jgi:cysteine sulfinate desulfinase/cysteine desulfurase-like protein
MVLNKNITKRRSFKKTEQNSKKKNTKKATPKKATPKKATPKKATPKKATPKKATPKKATPKKATPKKATPKKDVDQKTNKTAAKKAAPKKDVAQKTNKTAAKKAVAQKAVAQKAVAQKAALFTHIYFDNTYSPSLCPAAETMYKKYMNSSDVSIIETCKEQIKKLCCPDNYTVFFTSSEAESNTTIIQCAVNAFKKIRKIKPHIIISSIEHPSIIACAKSMFESDQIELSTVSPNIYGCITSDSIEQLIKPNTCFASIAYINGVLGSVSNLEKIGAIFHSKKIPIHSDCSYMFGRHTLNLSIQNIDAATISFDKINSATGLSALLINNDLLEGYKLYEHASVLNDDNIPNLAAIASASEAIKCAMINRKEKNIQTLKMRNTIIGELTKSFVNMPYTDYINNDDPPFNETHEKPILLILGSPASNESYYTPSILTFAIVNKLKEINLRDELLKKKIIVSSPNASLQNYVLNAIEMPDEIKQYTTQVFISDYNTTAYVDKLISCIKNIYL